MRRKATGTILALSVSMLLLGIYRRHFQTRIVTVD